MELIHRPVLFSFAMALAFVPGGDSIPD